MIQKDRQFLLYQHQHLLTKKEIKEEMYLLSNVANIKVKQISCLI